MGSEVDDRPVAVVTGASRGIGRAVAIELARRGHRVLATMRNPDDGDAMRAAAGSSAALIEVARLDVTAVGSFEFPASTAILVNNAGGMENDLPFEHTSLDEWRRVFEVNLFAPVELTRRVVPIMRAGAGGVICNVSTAGILQPLPWVCAYRAAKMALSSLDDSLRVELAHFGIRMVEILPAMVETDSAHDSPMMRPPMAADFEGYEVMAKANSAGFESLHEFLTPPAVAAVRFVDAIFDPDRPMRQACDPVAGASLKRWRALNDEELYAHSASGRPGAK